MQRQTYFVVRGVNWGFINPKFVKEPKSTSICRKCGFWVITSKPVEVTCGKCQQPMALVEHIDDVEPESPEPQAQHA